jgi:proteic killer suppression protein
MEIHVSNKRLRADLEGEGARRRRFGNDMAKKLGLRLDALGAAQTLADFWPPNSGPERCHELKGDMTGTFSVDLKHPYRLLFRPIEAKPPEDRSDELARWRSITEIDIVAVEDTHG